jgi:hypothetical protein
MADHASRAETRSRRRSALRFHRLSRARTRFGTVACSASVELQIRPISLILAWPREGTKSVLARRLLPELGRNLPTETPKKLQRGRACPWLRANRESSAAEFKSRSFRLSPRSLARLESQLRGRLTRPRLVSAHLKKIVVNAIHLHEFSAIKTTVETGETERVIRECRKLFVAADGDGKGQSNILAI